VRVFKEEMIGSRRGVEGVDYHVSTGLEGADAGWGRLNFRRRMEWEEEGEIGLMNITIELSGG